ncbi:MAG: serine/threonine-protein kinase [Beijerinckiaceae bacterium]
MSDKLRRESTPPIISAGTQLNSLYEIDQLIAVGGMGEVYRGHAIQTGDPVAIKLIRLDLSEADAAFALFRKEAAALHNLYHEAIVRYYVFTTDPALGRPYLAMEFVNGESLSAILRKGPLPCEEVYRLMVRIAAGLQAAHEQDIIHRDVSPDNIIIPGGDMKRAKIIDFGIARSNRLDSGGTIIGSGFAGKYNYVSPEQLGLFGGDVTPKSDIYSLGLVLAEALRQKPIDMGGNHVDVIEKRRKVPELSGVDARLRPLLETMLRPNPIDRPESMAEVAAWPFEAKPRPASPKPPARAKTIIDKTIIDKASANRTGAPKAAASKTGAAGTIANKSSAAKARADLQQHKRKDEPFPRLNSFAVGAVISLAIAAAFGAYRIWGPHPIIDEPKRIQIIPKVENSIAGMTNFVSEYDGGPCFFVKPLQITDKSALLEGYGVTRAPFDRLDDAFRAKTGFEAEIGAHEVAPAQCPALDLVGQLRSAKAAAPKIALSQTALKLGQNLTGMIDGIGGRQIDLLLVADDGSVRLLKAMPYPPTDEKMPFSARLGPTIANGKLQLLVAIASPKPLPIIQNAALATAQDLFPRVFEEARRDGLGLGASLRSFKLDR